MKIELMNGTVIECTVDEYEELYSRGLIGNKKDLLQEGLKELTKWPKDDYTPKSPYDPPVVALYGCQVAGPTSLIDSMTSKIDCVEPHAGYANESIATNAFTATNAFANIIDPIEPVKSLLNDKQIKFAVKYAKSFGEEIEINGKIRICIMFILRQNAKYSVNVLKYNSDYATEPFDFVDVDIDSADKLDYLLSVIEKDLEEL